MTPGTGSHRSHVEFHRRGRFDATITLHDGRNFGVVRQGLALRRRSLYDRLRAIAQYDHWRRPDTVLILTPQRMGAAEDGEVLHQQRSPRLLHRRGVQGRPRKTGPSHLVRTHGAVRTLVLHTGDGQLPRQARRRA